MKLPHLPIVKVTAPKTIRWWILSSLTIGIGGAVANSLGYKWIWATSIVLNIFPAFYINLAPKINFWLHGKNKYDVFEEQLNNNKPE